MWLIIGLIDIISYQMPDERWVFHSKLAPCYNPRTLSE